MRKNKLLIPFLFLLLQSNAHATDITLEVDNSPISNRQSIDVDGDFAPQRKDEKPVWGWDAGYSYTKSTESSGDGESDIIDHTPEITGALNWKSPESGWGAGGDLVWSKTSEESLVSGGADLDLTYKYKYALDSGTSDFIPWIKTKLSLGKRSYTQFFSSTLIQRNKKRVIIRPVSGTNEIVQTSASLNESWNISSAWLLSLGANFYLYNRSVADFMSYLDSARSVSLGIGGLSNTVGGLPLSMIKAKAGVDLMSWLNFDLEEDYSVSASDLSHANATRGVFEAEFLENYKISLGAEYSASSTGITDTTSIIGLEGDF